MVAVATAAFDWSLMVPARPPTPCKSTKSRLPDAEITKGRRSLIQYGTRGGHGLNSFEKLVKKELACELFLSSFLQNFDSLFLAV